jgi:shikimate kinase
MKVILVGYMGSGKSVVARELAELLGCRFIDTDEWIEARACKTIPEIFSQDGEAAFRKKEKECLEFLMDHDHIVLSTGGGMPCFNDAIDLMLELGETIYLDASIETLTNRLWVGKSGRPILKDFKEMNELAAFISHHLSERLDCYQKSKHSVVVDDKSVARIAQEIKSALES